MENCLPETETFSLVNSAAHRFHTVTDADPSQSQWGSEAYCQWAYCLLSIEYNHIVVNNVQSVIFNLVSFYPGSKKNQHVLPNPNFLEYFIYI